jgi:hypothetical protein
MKFLGVLSRRTGAGEKGQNVLRSGIRDTNLLLLNGLLELLIVRLGLVGVLGCE